MTRTSMKIVFSVLLSGFLATSVQAGNGRGSRGHAQAVKQSQAFSQQVRLRQTQQLRRIETARRSGLLSRHDFRALSAEQQRIRALERQFRANGIIDAREFRRLERALDLAARKLRNKTLVHNTRPAYGASHRFN